jgi:hypothetical protein
LEVAWHFISSPSSKPKRKTSRVRPQAN